VAVREIVANLRQIVSSEGWDADDDALTLIGRQATGSIRDAQSLLDQLSSAGIKITLDLTQAVLGTATSQTVLDIIDFMDRQNSAAAMETLRRAVDSGTDPRTLARQIVEYLRGLLLLQLGNPSDGEAVAPIREHVSAQAARFSSGEVLRMMKAFNSAATDTRGGWQPSLSLELAIAEVLEDRSGRSRPIGKAGGAPESTSGQAATSGGTRASGATMEEPSSDQAAGEARDLPARRGARQLSPRGDEAQTTAEPEGTRADGASSPPVGLSQIARSWKDIRLALRPSHPGVEALLNSCKPVEVQGDELTLGFQSETVRALMDKPENIKAARQAIAEVLGSNLKITCVVTNARGKVPPNLAPDGMVATAVDHGGEIVDLQE
jgi:DNA polymerase-3 subunit gamma/tau